MEITDIQENQFVDLFPAEGEGKSQAPRFGANEKSTALFGSATDTTTQAASSSTDTTTLASTTDTTTVPGSSTDTTTESTTDTTTVEADLFGTEEEKNKAGRRPKYDFKDTSGYFADRFKSGKFVAIEEEAEDGSKKPFIPQTPEEFDEVIDIQVNYKLAEERKELEKKIYSSKSPAWQAVLKYAEMTDDPAEVLPFIQGVRNIQSVAEIDETTPEGAEQIVRTRLLQRGEGDDVIAEQIDALKGADKLISTAAKYKPVILNEEKQNLQALTKQREDEEKSYQALVTDIRKNAITAIETPLFGKAKLKQDEKAAIYDLIAEPDEQTKGYGIYSVIDNLFEKRDFETLRQVALLLTKRESFVGYISTAAADKTSEGLQKKLRVSTEGRGSSTNDDPSNEGTRQVVNRTQFKSQARFGR